MSASCPQARPMLSRSLSHDDLVKRHQSAYERLIEHYPEHGGVTEDSSGTLVASRPGGYLRWHPDTLVWTQYSLLSPRDELAERWRVACSLEPWALHRYKIRQERRYGGIDFLDPLDPYARTGRTTRGLLYALVDCVTAESRELVILAPTRSVFEYCVDLASEMRVTVLLRLELPNRVEHALHELQIGSYFQHDDRTLRLIAGPCRWLIYRDHSLA